MQEEPRSSPRKPYSWSWVGNRMIVKDWRPPTSYIDPKLNSYSARWILLHPTSILPIDPTYCMKGNKHRYSILLWYMKGRKAQTYNHNRVVSMYTVLCTSWYRVSIRWPPYVGRHSVSHFKFSIIALGLEEDWKCQQFLTVVLQTKNEVSIGNPHHSTSYLGIGGVGSYYEYFECRGDSSRRLQYCNSKLFICDSQDYFHSVNEYWMYISRT